MKIFTCILFTLLVSQALAQPYKGDIAGKVVDTRTMEPIPGVHIILVESPSVGTSTDEQGAFRIREVGVGTYSIRISSVGYAPRVITNVVVTTRRATPFVVKLEEEAVEVQEVTTSASYFTRAQQMSPVSTNLLDRSEVLRSPGGIQDVQRVTQNLPGVASSTDNINELIVRGGAPFENLTIMDNMEIPSINHYSNDFNSAGPINMVNADMVEDVQFSAGGFPVRYGDKSSSVMNLTVREGNRNKPFASKTAINMAGAGTLIEGGFAGGKGSYIFSLRNSLLEVIDKVMGLSTISLTSVPKYWDTQAKVVYDLSAAQKLSFNLLYGDGRINIDGDPKGTDDLRRNMIDSSSVDRLYPRTKLYAAGLTLRSLHGDKGYSLLTVYGSGRSDDINVDEDFAVRQRGAGGEVLSYQTIASRRIFSESAIESFVAAKYELFYQVHPQHELSVGAQLLTTSKWSNDVFIGADTARYDLNRDGIFETGPVIVPPGNFNNRLGFGDASKYYMYAGDRFAITPDWELRAGVRYDRFTYSGRGSLSPRASLSWKVVPPTTTLTFAVGRYDQTQPLPYYSDRRDLGYNRNLENMRADHYVLGFEQILGRGLKLSVEAYYKRYVQDAVAEDFIYSAIDTFWSDRILTVGDRTAYGAEFFLEQKQVEDFFGTVSISLSKSREKDPRIPALVHTFPTDYDYPVVATMLAGKVVKGVRDWLNETPFFLKYPSYILPFSNEMEVSFRYRYQTGRPYTPAEYVSWKQEREGGVKWSNGAWVESSSHNSARYPDYSRLDIQWLSRFYREGWNINVYIALMNVLNQKNVFYQDHRSDGTVETVYQFAFFPVGGGGSGVLGPDGHPPTLWWREELAHVSRKQYYRTDPAADVVNCRERLTRLPASKAGNPGQCKRIRGSLSFSGGNNHRALGVSPVNAVPCVSGGHPDAFCQPVLPAPRPTNSI